MPAVTRAPQAPNAPVVQSAPLVAETVDARFARLRNYHQIDPISLTEEQKALEEKQRNGMHACLYVCMYMNTAVAAASQDLALAEAAGDVQEILKASETLERKKAGTKRKAPPLGHQRSAGRKLCSRCFAHGHNATNCDKPCRWEHGQVTTGPAPHCRVAPCLPGRCNHDAKSNTSRRMKAFERHPRQIFFFMLFLFARFAPYITSFIKM